MVPFEKYLLFNDDWGTHRGYIWHLAIRIYQKFPILHKLFGYGPDTFGIITVQGYFDEMVGRYNENSTASTMNIFSIW